MLLVHHMDLLYQGLVDTILRATSSILQATRRRQTDRQTIHMTQGLLMIKETAQAELARMRQDEARHNVRPGLVPVHLPSFLPSSVFVGLISSLVDSPNF